MIPFLYFCVGGLGSWWHAYWLHGASFITPGSSRRWTGNDSNSGLGDIISKCEEVVGPTSWLLGLIDLHFFVLPPWLWAEALVIAPPTWNCNLMKSSMGKRVILRPYPTIFPCCIADSTWRRESRDLRMRRNVNTSMRLRHILMNERDRFFLIFFFESCNHYTEYGTYAFLNWPKH